MPLGLKVVIQRRGLREIKRRTVSCHARSVYTDSNKENMRVSPDKWSHLWRGDAPQPQIRPAKRCQSQHSSRWEGGASGRLPNWA